jgi:hypothetical protein
MKAFTGLFQRLDRKQETREIEEELRFHLDRLTEENCRQDLSWNDARALAQQRFGNLEQFRDQCVEISRRNHPSLRALKLFASLIFLMGILVRVFSPEYHVTRVGTILMAVGFLGRLLLYVRCLNPSSTTNPDDSAPLKLFDSKGSIEAYDQRNRTPVERVISYK